MKKYLSYFSYIGTKFNGVQRQLSRHLNPSDTIHHQSSPPSSSPSIDPRHVNTVQQMLDDALQRICPRPLSVYTGKVAKDDNLTTTSPSPPPSPKSTTSLLLKTGLASRTDKGVHAIQNVYTFELEHPHGLVYKPVELSRMINNHLIRNECEVIVNRTVLLHDTFNVFLAARTRRYVYRLAILKPEVFKGRQSILNMSQSSSIRLKSDQSFSNPYHQGNVDTYIDQFLPIIELYRVLAINSTYDVLDNRLNEFSSRMINLKRMRQACNKFVGTHDFDSFRMPYKGKTSEKVVDTVKTIHKFDLLEADPSPAQLQLDARYSLFDWFHLIIEADSFLYRQVRKMVGTVIAVGLNDFELEQIDFLLHEPDHKNWLPHFYTAPAHGLYLQQVNLDDALFGEEEEADDDDDDDDGNEERDEMKKEEKVYEVAER